jgi:hypothetical protein
MTSRDQGRDRRRFPRIFLQSAEEFQKLVGAQVIWPSGSKTDVMDLSYTGAAVAQPSGNTLEKGNTLTLGFSFSGQQPVPVSARVVRTDGLVAGFQFDELGAHTRLAFETFLNDNLLGLNLRPVSPSLFNQSQDFSQWYHGPKDTNVFIWANGNQVQKAIVEIDNQILVWNAGVLSQGKCRQDLISAIEDYYSPVLYESVRAGASIESALINRVVKVLSQVKESSPQIRTLLENLNQSVSA